MGAAEREPVGRAIDVLSWLATHPQPSWSIRQVARALDMSPTTIHRIFGIFENRKILEKDGEGGYLTGIKLFSICHSFTEHMSPIRIVRPHLEALSAECDETAILGTYDAKRGEMMFIDVAQAPHPVQYLSKLNEWIPIHSGATGLAILAFLPEAERKAIYARGLSSVTDRTLVNEKEIEAVVAAVRARGYACTHGQRTIGAVGIAAPIFDSNDHVCGDVCVTIPEQRFTDSMMPTVGAAVLSTSKIVTGELQRAGYRRGVA